MGAVLYPPTKETDLRVARFGLIATLFISVAPAHAQALSEADKGVVHESAFKTPDVLRLQAQMKVKHTMPPAYWWDVAQCETRRDWQDGGKWGGGLGIATTTWTNYGGREFANHPSRATIAEQMIVANRIAVLGYQTKRTFMTLEDKQKNRPFFRPRAGFFGWGCIKANRYLHPQNWRDNNRRHWVRGKKNVELNLWKPIERSK